MRLVATRNFPGEEGLPPVPRIRSDRRYSAKLFARGVFAALLSLPSRANHATRKKIPPKRARAKEKPELFLEDTIYKNHI
jgi:hypothetical protein